MRSSIRSRRSSTCPVAGTVSTLGVHEMRRPDDLFDHLLGVVQLVVAGGRADVQQPLGFLLELLEGQRAVVVGGRQPKAVFDQRVLPGFVARELALYLREGDVGLVDDTEEVVGEVVQQGVGGLARLAVRQMNRVVLDARTVAGLLEHLDVERRALFDPLGGHEVALSLKVVDSFFHQPLDLRDRLFEGVVGDRVVFGGVDQRGRFGRLDLACERVDFQEAVDLVTPELHADRIAAVHRKDLDGITPDPEGALREVDVVALVVEVDQPRQQIVAVDLLVDTEFERHIAVDARIPQPVDRRHRGDDDHVVPREQRPRGGVAEPLDLLVDRHILVDVGVGLLDVGFGLVVVVIRDEIFDRIIGVQISEFLVQLGRQRLVVGQHERRRIEFLDDPRDRVRLSGAGHAKQGLFVHPALVARD